MPIAIDPGRVVDYVLEADRKLPKEKQTIFKVKVLRATELARLQDEFSVFNRDGSFTIKTGSKELAILDMGITGWENFKDKNGKTIPFDEKNPDRWDVLRRDYRTELANFITEQTQLNEDELKN